jgi:hypothetical protein
MLMFLEIRCCSRAFLFSYDKLIPAALFDQAEAFILAHSREPYDRIPRGWKVWRVKLTSTCNLELGTKRAPKIRAPFF